MCILNDFAEKLTTTTSKVASADYRILLAMIRMAAKTLIKVFMFFY